MAPASTGAERGWAGIIATLIVLLLGGAALMVWLQRRGRRDAEPAEPLSPAPPQPGPPARPDMPRQPSPPAALLARPVLAFEFRPRRAGTNVTSVAVDYELVVRNAGEAPIETIRIGVDLVTAGNAHDEQLRTLFAHPVERPIVPPFALAPGEERVLRAMVMLPKDGVSVVSVKGRPMFVPIVAINAVYRWSGGEGQAAVSRVIGIDRGEGERMRPFWLDVAPRMHDRVNARAHAVAVER